MQFCIHSAVVAEDLDPCYIEYSILYFEKFGRSCLNSEDDDAKGLSQLQSFFVIEGNDPVLLTQIQKLWRGYHPNFV